MRRLAIVLLAAGLIVWLAAPALSSRPFIPRAVEFEQALPTGDWTRAADGRWRSPVVVAPQRFDLVGLRWRGPAAAAVQIRVRDGDDGRWGRWTTMAGDHAGGAGAEPAWAGGADAYQVRLDRRPRGLRARFVNATGSATAADRVRTALRRAAHATLAALAGSAAQAQRGPPPAAAPRRRSSRARRGAPSSARRARRPPTARYSSASCTTPSTRTRTRAEEAPRSCWRSAATTATRTAGTTSATTSSSTASGRSSRVAPAASTRP